MERKIGNDDFPAMQAFLDSMKHTEHSHMILTRFEEDSLHLYTNADRGWLMYLRKPDDFGLYVQNPDEPSEPQEYFSCECGIDLEFPRNQTLPVEAALKVMLDFFNTGRLPEWCLWTEDQH